MPFSKGVLDHVDLRLVQTSSDVYDFFEWLGRKREVLGVDTETSALDIVHGKIRYAQFGDLTHGWAIPWQRWSGVAVEAIKKYEGPVVFHNAPFDVKFLQKDAPEIGQWAWDRTNDTMTMGHILDPLRPKGLKPLGAMYVDASAASAQKILDDGMANNKWDWATVPLDYPPYWVYAAMDPVITAYLYDRFKKDVFDTSAREAYGLELGALRVVCNMMRKGARVDLDYCNTQMHDLGGYVQKIMDYIGPTFGIGSVDSAAQIEKAMVSHGISFPEKYTRGGAQSWDKDVLEQIDHDLARYILQVRKIQKFVRPYFRNFARMADYEDSDGTQSFGRVHPTIWSSGTRTARQSITEPALQTLPRKDPTVRHAFVPSPGNVLIAIDADQIEARLTAHFSGDRGMIDAFGGEDDFFVSLARKIFKDPELQKNDPRRQLTKNTTYGKIYGAGPAKMAATAGIPINSMIDFVSAFDQMFPGITKLQRAINVKAMERKRLEGDPYIVTPYGRKLKPDDDREYTLTNYLIQSHAAEILKRNLILLDLAGMGDYLILPVHDEIVMDVPAEIGADVLRDAEKIMNDHENYAVPITWSGDIMTKSWGEKYEK